MSSSKSKGVKLPIAQVNRASITYDCWYDNLPVERALRECQALVKGTKIEDVRKWYVELDELFQSEFMQEFFAALKNEINSVPDATAPQS